MKKIIAVMIAVIFITLLLPLAVVWLCGEVKEEPTETGSIKVYDATEKTVKDMGINEYLKCAVSAEMPADFEIEALKAQAVAARTYLYSHIEQAEKGNVDESHKGGVICTDSTHCQAYISEEKRRESWGENADEYWNKISNAVDETTGEIMTYNGEIISAVYHSTSSGNTEDAVDVWGSDVPYLKSVKSEGDLKSPKYESELTISEDEYKKTLEGKVEGTDWTKGLAENIVRSDAGGIISIDVGGVTIKGTEFRSIFSLRSTNADITFENGDVKMSVKGYGHGVGMSQYGANYMAQQGDSYEDILKTYYIGVEIEKR